MKKVICLVLITLILCSSCTTIDNAKEPQRTNPVPEQPEAGKSYSAIGSSLLNQELAYVLNNAAASAEVIKLLGEPEEKSEAVIWDADGLEHQTWFYNAEGLRLDFTKGDRDTQTVNSAYISSPSKLKTIKGIGIGSTREEILETYKEQINKEENNIGTDSIVVGTVYGGLTFKLEKGKVASIFIGAGAE